MGRNLLPLIINFLKYVFFKGDIKSYYYQVWFFWYCSKPPKLPFKAPKFPSLHEYRKLEKSPIFGIEDFYSKEDRIDLVENDENASSSCFAGLCLREYQLEGVNWLLWNWWHKRPCILADEMGLGYSLLFF
jgi:SNF2 family DNA or RNA helicase